MKSDRRAHEDGEHLCRAVRCKDTSGLMALGRPLDSSAPSLECTASTLQAQGPGLVRARGLHQPPAEDVGLAHRYRWRRRDGCVASRSPSSTPSASGGDDVIDKHVAWDSKEDLEERLSHVTATYLSYGRSLSRPRQSRSRPQGGATDEPPDGRGEA
ncbi:MAG: hypothetical protein MZV70_54515 [Desulfobacterales bacterium]|nr:hypothetical protein [Desulfobacterales bacterium]